METIQKSICLCLVAGGDSIFNGGHHTATAQSQGGHNLTVLHSAPLANLHRFSKLWNDNMQNYQRIVQEDLTLPCEKMAIYLLGKLLVRKLEDGSTLKGRIVETECYLGGEDKASHSYNGRKTPRTEPMYMASSTSYVYMTYGMYYCFNISAIEAGAAVLIRALEPIQGLEIMRSRRLDKRKASPTSKPLKCTDICNGSSKLCMSMDITIEMCNKLDLATSDVLWIEDDNENTENMQIVTSTRIGIASAGAEWASKPLRFYIMANPHVSKRDRRAERDLLM